MIAEIGLCTGLEGTEARSTGASSLSCVRMKTPKGDAS